MDKYLVYAVEQKRVVFKAAFHSEEMARSTLKDLERVAVAVAGWIIHRGQKIVAFDKRGTCDR